MKKLLSIISIAFFTTTAFGQINNKNDFHGAEATLKSYKALYFVDQSDEKKIKGTLRNINNVLNDPRLKGKVTVELVAFGDGVEMYKKENHYDTLLTALLQKGVLLVECENTIRERKINKDELWSFISYTPSGNGEIVIRQQQGWAVVHP